MRRHPTPAIVIAIALRRHAADHSCFGCYNTWLNENRDVFDLHPAILGNFWRNYLRRA